MSLSSILLDSVQYAGFSNAPQQKDYLPRLLTLSRAFFHSSLVPYYAADRAAFSRLDSDSLLRLLTESSTLQFVSSLELLELFEIKSKTVENVFRRLIHYPYFTRSLKRLRTDLLSDYTFVNVVPWMIALESLEIQGSKKLTDRCLDTLHKYIAPPAPVVVAPTTPPTTTASTAAASSTASSTVVTTAATEGDDEDEKDEDKGEDEDEDRKKKQDDEEEEKDKTNDGEEADEKDVKEEEKEHETNANPEDKTVNSSSSSSEDENTTKDSDGNAQQDGTKPSDKADDKKDKKKTTKIEAEKEKEKEDELFTPNFPFSPSFFVDPNNDNDDKNGNDDDNDNINNDNDINNNNQGSSSSESKMAKKRHHHHPRHVCLPSLFRLNISRCPDIRGVGFAAIPHVMPNLRSFILHNSTHVDAKFLLKECISKLCKTLVEVEIVGHKGLADHHIQEYLWGRVPPSSTSAQKKPDASDGDGTTNTTTTTTTTTTATTTTTTTATTVDEPSPTRTESHSESLHSPSPSTCCACYFPKLRSLTFSFCDHLTYKAFNKNGLAAACPELRKLVLSNLYNLFQPNVIPGWQAQPDVDTITADNDEQDPDGRVVDDGADTIAVSATTAAATGGASADGEVNKKPNKKSSCFPTRFLRQIAVADLPLEFLDISNFANDAYGGIQKYYPLVNNAYGGDADAERLRETFEDLLESLKLLRSLKWLRVLTCPANVVPLFSTALTQVNVQTCTNSPWLEEGI